jgi:hypothetical protein
MGARVDLNDANLTTRAVAYPAAAFSTIICDSPLLVEPIFDIVSGSLSIMVAISISQKTVALHACLSSWC